MPDTPLRLSGDALDWYVSLGLVALWLVLTMLVKVRRSRRPVSAAQALVVCASQTGHAGDLAEQTRQRIAATGASCALLEADALTPELLAAAELAVFIASTTGEGEAPDNARRFEQSLLGGAGDLNGKQVAVLALGDRRYRQFCGFGRRIAAWAERSGAQPLFPHVEVDDLSPADLAVWDRRLTAAGYPPSLAQEAVAETAWVVAAREQVAGPSRNREGAPTAQGLFRIALRPAAGGMPEWEIGDLFELRTPDGHLRDYSIASLPGEEAIVLFVRRVMDGGVPGLGSGHITGAQSEVVGRLRSHRSFRPPAGDGPLLAIGAGSGWAGLRPHLLHAMQQEAPCRLVFGERAAETDSPILAEMRDWQAGGRLDRLDLALSRPAGDGGPYVQHVLGDAAPSIAEFLGAQGRIVICGRLAMGEHCLAELADLLSPKWLERAREDGRLRRDLY